MSQMNSNMENEREIENNYALRGKIMLTAIIILFIVIIIMLCLHVLIRYYNLRARSRQHHRRTRRQPFIFYVDPSAPTSLTLAVSRGLDASVISSLPVFKFSSKTDQAVDCAVCLSEFEEGETGRVLPKCNHSFHIDCIDMWFQSHSTCPLCRAPVEAPPVQQEVTIDMCEPELVLGSSFGHEMNRSEPEFSSSSSSSCSNEKQSSFVGVKVEIPGRSECDCESSDSPSSFRSPMNRVLSFTRILSRERKASVSPSSDCVAVGESVMIEKDAERGGRDEETQ